MFLKSKIKMRPDEKEPAWTFKAYNSFTQRWRTNNVSVVLFRRRNAVENNWISQITINLTAGQFLLSQNDKNQFSIKLSSVKGHQEISFLLQNQQITKPPASQKSNSISREKILQQYPQSTFNCGFALFFFDARKWGMNELRSKKLFNQSGQHILFSSKMLEKLNFWKPLSHRQTFVHQYFSWL